MKLWSLIQLIITLVALITCIFIAFGIRSDWKKEEKKKNSIFCKKCQLLKEKKFFINKKICIICMNKKKIEGNYKNEQ